MATISMDDAVRLAAAAGFPRKEIATAAAVAKSESGLDTAAVNTRNTNGSTDTGLWQINSVHGYSPAELLDPAGNARAAYAVWRRQGWSAWSDYRNGRYLAHTPEAFGAGVRTGATTGKVGPGDLGKIAADLARNPGQIPDAAGTLTGLSNPLDPLASLGRLAAALGNPDWWRRLGVGALGVALIVAGLAFLGRDLITDTARQIVSGVTK